MKRIALTFLTALSLVIVSSVAVGGNALAVPDCSATGAKQKALEGINNTAAEACDTNGVNETIAAVTNLLSYVVGVVAFIAIISGAFKYITSGGDATKVTNAKHTILYALVGIAVVALAQFMIRVVFNVSSNAAQGCKSGETHYSTATDGCVPN